MYMYTYFIYSIICHNSNNKWYFLFKGDIDILCEINKFCNFK